jgi:membrane-bound lytic murein transglycosylase B
VFIAEDNLFDAFDSIERNSQIFASLKDVLDKIQQVKIQLDQQAQSLIQQQDEAKNLLSIKTLQQQKLSGSVSAQSSLLKETKGKESNYQTALSDSRKRAIEIRNRLYQLLGVSTQITFGQALEIAQWASDQTGVRAAFLLAILTQESNLGKNVGTCNRPGDPPEKGWRVIMKPDRDQQPFLIITKGLGMDTDITPVSCPMHDSNGDQIGWGGAMGPAQFIPSTWMGWKDKVSAITGKTANPWDIRDAFIAAALKLKAGGAGTKSGEWAAAMLYFSGSTNVRFRFYGDSVVAMANQYQIDIDSL